MEKRTQQTAKIVSSLFVGERSKKGEEIKKPASSSTSDIRERKLPGLRRKSTEK